MKYVNLGNSGLRVSRICFGVMTYGSKEKRPWALSEDEARPYIRKALEGGINFFDTAEMYQNGESEEILGRALRDYASHREDVIIASKVFSGTVNRKENRFGLSRKHILHQIDQSLRRLQTDYIDLYQTHRWDYNTPIEETLDALNDVVHSGKVRYIGASSMWAWQFERALNTSNQYGYAGFISMQNYYNLVYREEEREMIPLCRDRGIGIIPWSPLARGFLGGNLNKDGSGNTIRGQTDKLFKAEGRDLENDYEILDRVNEVAEQQGKSPAQIALAWLLAQPGLTAPITSATQMEHLEQAIAAVDIELTQEQIDYLAEPYQPHVVIGHK
ncbi:MAG: aldo/keto reductase [Gammaproteobacteria bacterium]